MKDEADSGNGDPGRWAWGHPSSLASALSIGHRRCGRWALLGGVLSGIALLTLLFAFGLRRDPSLVGSALVGRPAPRFDLASLDGNGRVRLTDLRGQVVVVNFWGSWCQGCRQEHNALAEAWQRYRDQGVVFVGISFQDSTSAAKAFAQELQMDWPLVMDQASKTAIAYGVYGAPETFFISRRGKVQERWIGPIDYETLTDAITRLQGGGASR